MDLTDSQLAHKIWEAIIAGECMDEYVGPSADTSSSDEGTNCEVRVHEAGHHHSGTGDIWVAAHSKVEHEALLSTVPLWLPWLSDKLHAVPTTYPIIAHDIPTSFDPSHNSNNIAVLLEEDHQLIGHLSALQHAEFIPRALDRNHSKAHS